MTRWIPSPPGRVVLAALLAMAAGAPARAQAPDLATQLWRDVDEAAIGSADAYRVLAPGSYRTLQLDQAALLGLLEQAPREGTDEARAASVVLPLPLPAGGFARFRIEDSPIMEDALAAAFPEIKTYRGQGIDDRTATVRFDWTPDGFHAMVLSAAGTLFVDPYVKGDTAHYVVYDKKDYSRREKPDFDCAVTGRAPEPTDRAPAIDAPANQLQVYRLALAATGEYTAFQGGTVSGALSAMTTTMNRVNGVYEKDLAVRMVMVANETSIIYTNASTDPYTNNDGSTMLGQNQTNLTNVIGSANYDIGHVFSTGGGGIAGLGVVCSSTNKARGVTGSSAPVGDGFDIDYVAHEMGHQFGGNHTFNGTTGSCGGGNRSANAAYEPGSGSTIMPYAGICGAEDLQPHSDDYFHAKSLLEITAFLAAGGAACDAPSATGNQAPTVDAGASFTIPSQTPFTLTATASDPDGDALTYCWEEYDLGTASPPNTDNGNRPIFRSFNPTTSPARTFPKLSDVLSNTATFGESLPTTTRTMTFRATVRDNRSGGGGFATDTTTVNVRADSGPFAVTAPNTAVTWAGGTTQTVTWNVANTSAAPVSAANVNIRLSTDGGNTFPTVLAANTPNDGSQAITVPSATTSTARVKVEAVGNVFFDVSNANFTITPGGGGNQPPTANAGPDQAVSAGATVTLPGSGSDPDGGPSPLSFSWTQVSGPSVTINNANQATASATLATAATYVFQLAVSDGAASATDQVSVTATAAGGTAVFDATLQAPKCATVSSACDSGASLLLGRGTLGPEPNQPNTINDSCADGTSGTFHSDESNDRVKVSTVDGTNFAAGKQARIDATVWAWTTPSQDSADFFFAADAANPAWTLIGTVVPTVAGAQTLSATYTIPSGAATQAVRVQFRYQSTNAACSAGGFNDRDDLVFAVTGSPVTTVFFDDFESATGWTTNPNGTDTATTGAWERGDPEDTTDTGPRQLGTTFSGTNDLVTARLAGSSAGANDVDGGVTSIQSPAITLPSTGTLTLSFQYYLAHSSNASSADFFRAFVVSGSTSTQVFQSLGAASSRNGAWTAASASLNAFAGQTVRIRFEAADASTASLIEAGVDDVRVTQQ